MDIVPKAGEAWVLDGGQTASSLAGPVQAQHAQAAPRKVGLQHQGIVTGSEDDAVEFRIHHCPSVKFCPLRNCHGLGLQGERWT